MKWVDPFLHRLVIVLSQVQSNACTLLIRVFGPYAIVTLAAKEKEFKTGDQISTILNKYLTDYFWGIGLRRPVLGIIVLYLQWLGTRIRQLAVQAVTLHLY